MPPAPATTANSVASAIIVPRRHVSRRAVAAGPTSSASTMMELATNCRLIWPTTGCQLSYTRDTAGGASRDGHGRVRMRSRGMSLAASKQGPLTAELVRVLCGYCAGDVAGEHVR